AAGPTQRCEPRRRTRRNRPRRRTRSGRPRCRAHGGTAARNAIIRRTGVAVDVHAFSTDPERQLWVAGLLWPGQTGLVRHSDSDVAAHACADAQLSTADPGAHRQHYGVDRPELAGASGPYVLAEAARIVRESGFEIGNVAAQVIGNPPKIGTRRLEAGRALSAAAGAAVSVSGTTADGLGLTGRGEGLAAIANAVVYPSRGASERSGQVPT